MTELQLIVAYYTLLPVSEITSLSDVELKRLLEKLLD